MIQIYTLIQLKKCWHTLKQKEINKILSSDKNIYFWEDSGFLFYEIKKARKVGAFDADDICELINLIRKGDN